MQEAWEQAGEVESANRLLDRGRFGRRIAMSLERRHIATRDMVNVLSLGGPVLSRLPHPKWGAMDPRLAPPHQPTRAPGGSPGLSDS